MASAGIGSSVEGIHAVAAALAAGRVTTLTVETGRANREPLRTLVSGAEQEGVKVRRVDDVRKLAATEAPQGVVAECVPLRPANVDDLADGDRPALLVLDHVQDPRNVGAIARSAAAAGMTGLVFSDVRAAPLSAAAFKAAAGALERLPVAVVASVPGALKRMSDRHLWIVGLDADGDRPLFGLDLLGEPVALVVGAEGRGLARLTRDRCNVLASIPMASDTESLNASVAASLASFEVRRVRTAVGGA